MPHLAFQPDELHATPIVGIESVVTAFYLRLRVATRRACWPPSPASWPRATSRSTPCCNVNRPKAENQTDVIILTHDTVEGRMRAALAQMQALPTVLAPIVSLRKEELA